MFIAAAAVVSSPGPPRPPPPLLPKPDRDSARLQKGSPVAVPPTVLGPAVAPKPWLSGWNRLRKQLLEEAGEPPGPPKAQPATPGPLSRPPASRAACLWDAVLYRMGVSAARAPTVPGKDPPARRLPLLCRPHFNARRLQRATWSPDHHATPQPRPPPRSFNRTATGWRQQ
ncbi:proline-rich protein 33 [Erinaceus europaeus]|uniref:Proline-rich protein 33 n=1 Tax=Erinaceus europaeus TaxID=9365 RepID=A0ABM3W9Q6_ERIEU|nr:proline-rich protein 33 [Erinaceus europaeus]XP_060033309.1 proline-rich protein 33 [Erinaceus europaeus]